GWAPVGPPGTGREGRGRPARQGRPGPARAAAEAVGERGGPVEPARRLQRGDPLPGRPQAPPAAVPAPFGAAGRGRKRRRGCGAPRPQAGGTAHRPPRLGAVASPDPCRRGEGRLTAPRLCDPRPPRRTRVRAALPAVGERDAEGPRGDAPGAGR